MKMKHLILLLLLALITMVGCLSPDTKGIDPIADETIPPDKGERGLVSLPDPFGVVDRSGEARNIDLLIPGATQSIEWKINYDFRFVNIYLYKEGKLYKTIVENIDNVGKYEWKSEETLDMAHNYEVVVSQHNGKPDENPYLTGDISCKFSMYPSAVRLALNVVNSVHSNETDKDKESLLVAYFKAFQEQGIQFMKNASGRGDAGHPEEFEDDSWVTNPLKRALYELALEYSGDVGGFLRALQYWGVYSEEMRDFLAWILKELFGFSGSKDENGNWHLENGAGDKIDILATDNGQFDDVTIIIDPADPAATHWTIKFTVSVTEYGDHYLISVSNSVYQNGVLFYVIDEIWNLKNGKWELISHKITFY